MGTSRVRVALSGIFATVMAGAATCAAFALTTFAGPTGQASAAARAPSCGPIARFTAVANGPSTASLRAPGGGFGMFDWGNDAQGQLGNGTVSSTPVTSPLELATPPGGAIQEVAGSDFAMAIGSDGNLYTWGADNEGQLGNGAVSTTPTTTPTQISLPGGAQAQEIAAGSDFALALDQGGNLYSWGDDNEGQLGNEAISTTPTSTPTAIKMPNNISFDTIAAGSDFALAVDQSGSVWTWGDNALGQLGDGSTSTTPTEQPEEITLPNGDNGWGGIAAGSDFAMAESNNGNLYTWGDGGNGQLGDDGTKNQDAPVQVSLPNQVGVSGITAGSDFAMARGNDGNLYSWGDNADGQLGIGSTAPQEDNPVQVTLPNSTQPDLATAGAGFAMAVGTDCRLYTWGDNSEGQLGVGNTTPSNVPEAVSLPQALVVTQLPAESLATSAYVLTGPQAPVVTASSATFVVGHTGSFQVPVVASPSATFSETGAMPSGLSLSPSGLISGTPAAGTAGQTVITLQAANGVAPAASIPFTITVDAPPAFTSSPTVTFPLRKHDSFQVVATGTPAPALSEIGTLPKGVTFSPGTGVISGTPKAGSAGTYPIGLVAANGVAPNAVHFLTLTVPPLTTGTTLTASPNPGKVGQSVTFTATVTAQGKEVPKGTVAFDVNGTTTPTCKSVGLTAVTGSSDAARATCTLTFGAPGKDHVQAVYQPGHDFVASVSPALTEKVKS